MLIPAGSARAAVVLSSTLPRPAGRLAEGVCSPPPLSPFSCCRERLAAAERELAGAQAQLRGVEAEACALDGVEQRYWHTFNDFQLRLGDHLGDRDALQHRCECVSQGLLVGGGVARSFKWLLPVVLHASLLEIQRCGHHRLPSA